MISNGNTILLIIFSSFCRSTLKRSTHKSFGCKPICKAMLFISLQSLSADEEASLWLSLDCRTLRYIKLLSKFCITRNGMEWKQRSEIKGVLLNWKGSPINYNFTRADICHKFYVFNIFVKTMYTRWTFIKYCSIEKIRLVPFFSNTQHLNLYWTRTAQILIGSISHQPRVRKWFDISDWEW